MVELRRDTQAAQGALWENDDGQAKNGATELSGTVLRILYSRGAWGLILLQRPNGQEVKAKGSILPLAPQNEVTLLGKWVPDDRRPGEEIFDVDEVEIASITTRRGLIAKLAELPHLGKQRAMAVVDAFGEEPKELLRILGEEPERVAEEIHGITRQRAQLIAMEIKGGWGESMERDTQLLKHLPRWVVSLALKRWPGPPETKETALDILYKDPYRLIELPNVGFKRADKAAIDAGIGLDDERRHRAALEYLIDQATQGNGHTWLRFEQCLEWSRKEQIDGIQVAEFERAADFGIEAGLLDTVPDDCAWLTTWTLSKGEQIIARRAREMAQRIEAEPINLTERYGLNELQARAVELAQTRRMLILTGGPGTGKTYTLQAILDAMEQQFQRRDFRGWGTICLCAPTGKAARRMSEMTGKPAATVHQTLCYKGDLDSFGHGLSNPLPVSLVVCDEASMLDTRLAAQLFASVPRDGRLILVGDVDQLPSVGPGKVLHDLIESQQVPVVRLSQVMRQADDSAIVTNAHALIHGNSLDVDNARYRDFKFFEIDSHEVKREERIETANKLIWAHQVVRTKLGFDLGDIQVLSPQRAGEIGVSELNRRLREQLNPAAQHKAEIQVGNQKRTMRVGDRVIQTRNDYDLGVMNGQIGTVAEVMPPDPVIQSVKGHVLVAFEGGQYIRYAPKQLKDLQLAYAITVHKSQGSEWPVVIIPVSTSHAKTLTRRLLYTAITRGKKLVVLVGTSKALRYAQKNIEDAQRQTRLLPLLQEGAPCLITP